MPRRSSIHELTAFLEVARERSFTKAAARLGVTASALSHTIRGLEERLKIRLLSRTTRNVAPTEAGERLLRAIGPRLEEIDAELAALSALRDRPAGTVRLSCSDTVAETILRPMLRGFLADYPDIHVEIVVDNGFTNIVAERLDAGIRLGDAVSRDMIAVRIGPDVRFTITGAPAYFARRSPPETPQELTNHACISLRLPTSGGRYAWEFERDGRPFAVRVDGPLTCNSSLPILSAALAATASPTCRKTSSAGMSRRGACGLC